MKHKFRIRNGWLYDNDETIIVISFFRRHHSLYMYKSSTKRGLRTQKVRHVWVIPMGDDYAT